MRLLRRLFPAVSLLALIAMAYGQYGIRRDASDTAATILFSVAAAAAAFLLGRGKTAPDEERSDSNRRSGVARAIAGTGFVVGMLAIVGAATLLSHNWRGWFLDAWLILLLGVCLSSAGLWGLDPPAHGGRQWSVGEAAAVLAILALGTFLRFYRYGEFPGPFATHAIEEQQTALGGYAILTEGVRPWEFMLDHYSAALAIWLSNDPTFITIRIPFTIGSALTILPVHLLLRQLVTIPAALAGTFLFSISSWNILYSRCAHNIFLTNFLVITVLGLLVHFGRTRRLALVPWAGLLSGYTLYAYAGYRGTSLFALVFLGLLAGRDLLQLVRASDEAAKRRAARFIFRDMAAATILLVIIGAVFAPVFVQVRADRGKPGYYFEAASRSLANNEYYTSNRTKYVRQRIERIRQAARIFMHVGDGALTFNAPGEPMLDPLTAVCFVGGLWLAVFFPWRPFHAFWLFMFLMLMLAGTVFVQNLDVRRLQGISVFVVLFAALFLDRLWAHARRLPMGLRRWGVPIVVTIGAVGTLRWNYDVYFHKMADNPIVREAFKNHYTALIHYGHEHGQDRYVLLISILRRYFDRSYYYRSHYSWLIDRLMRGRDVHDLNELLPPQALPTQDGPLTVLIQQPYEGEAVGRLLGQVYPGTHCSDFLEPDFARGAIVACDLPDERIAGTLTSTLEARYWLGAEPTGVPFLMRKEPFIAYATLPPQCYVGTPGPPLCYAEWSGTFGVALDSHYHFVAQPRGRTTMEVRIDDLPIGPTPIHLTAGTHRVWVRARLPREDDIGARLSWMRDGAIEVVPFYAVGGDRRDSSRSSPAEAAAEPSEF
jgi:hypothetical protein